MKKSPSKTINFSSVVKVSVTATGTLLVDRASLHASDAYKRQVNAFRQVVEKRIGKAPESVQLKAAAAK